MRAHLTLVAVAVVFSACDTSPDARDAEVADAASPVQRDATTQDDAAERDARVSEDTGTASDSGDGQTSDASADAGIDDALDAACAYDGAVVSLWECTGYVCKTDAGSALALETDGGWFVGGSEFSGALCNRALGWPGASTSDRHTLLYALTQRDREDLTRGAAAFVHRGDPFTSPVEGPLNPCTVEVAAEPPDCPATDAPPVHASRLGCRGPGDTGCAECRVLASSTSAATYRSAAPSGTSWYNVSGANPAGPCTSWDTCPVCAPCTYRDAEELAQLGERPECEPCPAFSGDDPCFGPGSCGCYCAQVTRLRALCPAL